MQYEVHLEKKKTYWWDEDSYGNAIFSAKDDEEARLFVTTVVLRMNRKYWRIGEQRSVIVSKIYRLKEADFSTERETVPIWNNLAPSKDFKKIRRILEAFYPKCEGKRRYFSIMHMFTSWKPITINS